MKAGLLTYQFAHNYGAMLQGYALKSYLDGLNELDVCIIPYYPKNFQATYEISPFVKGCNIKQRVYKVIKYFSRVKQSRKFVDFKKEYLYSQGITNEIVSAEEYTAFCNNLDLVIYGSDQIWNNLLNCNNPIYFGANNECIKISYAASVGTQIVNDLQRELFNKYLKTFKALSVREPGSKYEIKEKTGFDSQVVCDPVFLLGQEKWRKLESPVHVKKNYVLLYMLKRDEQLLNAAMEYAELNGLMIYAIHPTLSKQTEKVELLDEVGPKEFLWLIDHANCVCTNSFHAVSFSVIFRKKLIHIPNPASPDRTVALLNNIVDIKPDRGTYKLDLSKADFKAIECLVEESKLFLRGAINNIEH